nr:thioredoxin family protein [Treponema sp.]
YLMKKLLSAIAGICLVFSLLSCGQKIDSSTWITDFETGKKTARDEDKKIFLFFSEDDADEISKTLKDNVFNKEEFLKTYTEKYVLINLDFSQSRYESDQEGLSKDIKIYEKYNPYGNPAFIILSKEGYFITKLALIGNEDLDAIRIAFDEVQPLISEFEDRLERTKKGSKEDRLKAITELFDNTEQSMIHLLADLNKLYLSLDKDNSTGECAKHLLTLTYSKATEYYSNNNPQKAVEEFDKASKSKYLSPAEKQMCLYTSGYLLVQSGSKDYEKVKSYLQKAIDADPESENAQHIKYAIADVQNLIDGEGDAAPEEGPSPAPESNVQEAGAGEEKEAGQSKGE